MKKVLIRVLTVLLIAVFLFSAYKICSKLQQYHRGRSVYDDVIESVLETKTVDSGDKPSDLVPSVPVEIDFDMLREINPDVVAWVWSDFGINYPVMQSGDNNYYLRRMMNGEYNIVGSIFMDYRSAADITSMNTIIYGHNMNDDSMFGVLTDYESQDFYDSHPEIWLITPDTAYKIELLCAFTCQPDDEVYTDFVTESEMHDFLSRAANKSAFEAKTDISDIDRIVTFSTCSYEYTDARFVLIGRPVRAE